MLTRKFLAFILVIFFTLGFIACTSLVLASPTHDLESVSSVCPPSSPDGPCSNLQEHLSFWQTVLNATPSYFGFLLSILLLALFIPRIRSLVFHLYKEHFLKQKIPFRQMEFGSFRHVLQEAFSNGILHSKAY